MLKTLFLWLDQNPVSYWVAVIVPTLLLLGWAVAAAWREIHGRPPWREYRRIAALVLLAVLLAWRWPFLFSAVEYNPDESQFIAGAITLTHDPVFWRAVDGTTSGPLNFYILLPLHWLGLPLDYFSARLTGLLLTWITLLACHGAFRIRHGPAVARLGVLPATVFFCLVHEWDFVHFSSELLPMALTAIAADLILRGATASRWQLAFLSAGGFTAGLLPWAKLQAAPLGLVLALWAVWSALGAQPPTRPLRRLAALVAATGLPSLLILLLVTGTGQLSTFYHTYILQNLFYATSAHSESALQGLIAGAGVTHLLPALLLTCATLIVSALLLLGRRLLRPDGPFVFGCLLTATAIFSVLLPQRAFLHYTLLLIAPLMLWSGTALGLLWQELPARNHRRILVCFMLVAGAAVPLTLRCLTPGPEMFGRFGEDWRQPRSAESNIVHAFARPGDRLAVWGWSPRLYVETALPQATNAGYSYWCIIPSVQLDYHRTRFLADMERTAPAFFVDAVGSNAFYFKRRTTEAHESFPALRDHVRRHYVQVIDLGHARVYFRRDRLAEIRQRWAELPRLIAAGRTNAPAPLTPERFPPGKYPEKNIHGQSVHLMLPPARVSWPLRGDERRLVFDYGYDPAAATQPTGNGTEFIVELTVPGRSPQMLFRQLLDPAHRPAQRGRQRARVLLPPFPPGAQLTLRTTPGPFDDNAWDWAYAGRVQFQRSPNFLYQQFPRFNRLPVAVEGGSISRTEVEGTAVLMLHAPGTFTHVLHGAEQQVSFAYGFARGAHANGGRTDGAIYTLELQRGAEPAQTIFARHLQPLERASDRGRQHATVQLPPDLREGDRLVLRIAPGASESWDWTYVSDFILE